MRRKIGMSEVSMVRSPSMVGSVLALLMLVGQSTQGPGSYGMGAEILND
jgi:hypothetical protein